MLKLTAEDQMILSALRIPHSELQCSRDHWQIDSAFTCYLERLGVASIGMTHHAGSRIGGEHALEAAFSDVRP
jgi:hypothetical protein